MESDHHRAVSPKSDTSNSRNTDQTCHSCQQTDQARTPIQASPACFHVGAGEFLHDIRSDDLGLRKWVHHVQAASVSRFFYSYTSIIQRDRKRCLAAFKANPSANRYSDIPCIDDTRVKLADRENYIHANHIDGFRQPNKYILTQTPLSTTTEKFWDMIWQQKSVLIVSMYQKRNYSPYYPSSGEMTIGPYHIKHVNKNAIRNAYEATNFLVTNNGSQRHILHLNYFDWPSNLTPRRPYQVLCFLADIRHNHALLVAKGREEKWLGENELSPWVVECMTGSGRSASLVALDIICEKMDYSNDKGHTLCDVDDVIIRLRTQRGIAVQKPEQYIFINLAVLEYAIRKHYLTEEDAQELDLSQFALYPS